MAIEFLKQQNVFHIVTQSSSYLIKVLDSGHLLHLYYGSRVKPQNLDYLLRLQRNQEYLLAPVQSNLDTYLSVALAEYPTFGNTDMRSPAMEILHPDGSLISDFRYQSHRIFSGKPSLHPLPATYTQDQDNVYTLEITCIDPLAHLKLVLLYTAFYDHNAITRSVRLENMGNSPVFIKRLFSCSVDFPHHQYTMLTLHGAWARECQLKRHTLHCGMQSIQSRVGASSHMSQPFIALTSPNATETSGEAYGFSLVYSGNFFAGAEVDSQNHTRLQIGISPFQFQWKLAPKASFTSPEAVMIHSDCGIGQMSRNYHCLYRTRLARGRFRDQQRPILINSWEAAYFDFNGQSLQSLAQEAAQLGIELFVLDDGWFANRSSDDRALGDWYANEEKLGQSLHDLATGINKTGLQFGLWFEPEMVSPDSELYRRHPDWCLHVSGRRRSLSRNQLVLDLTRTEVCEAVLEQICHVLKSAPISYVKWDMNRNFTEIGSPSLAPDQQGEVAHRYLLNVYRMMETITSRFPNILFESCAGGGGRFDPGILYYMPQGWTSDNTDAIERLRIQFGASLVYPPSMMACHVSTVPNHQIGRTTPLITRATTAMMGQFGYELDPHKLTDQEKLLIKQQNAFYGSVRTTIQFGNLYRLQSPFESELCAWCTVSEDQAQVVVGAVLNQAKPNQAPKTLALAGLNPNAIYEITHFISTVEQAKKEPWAAVGRRFSGSELMHIGIPVPLFTKDYDSAQWALQQIT